MNTTLERMANRMQNNIGPSRQRFFNAAVAGSLIQVAPSPGPGRRLIIDNLLLSCLTPHGIDLQSAANVVCRVKNATTLGFPTQCLGPWVCDENAACSVIRSHGTDNISVSITYHIENL